MESPQDIGPTAPLEDALARLDSRPDWNDRPELDLPRHPAEKFLKGMIIVLDPGHGGDAHLPNYKRGPTGVREAEINLRVALLLRRLLEDAGVTVILTRDRDIDLSLEDRVRIANEAPRPDGGKGADLFLSLHHNAADNPTTNYTSVWHHAGVDGSEVELDVARPLALHLASALRTQVGKVSPILSDQLIYKTGFGVLRRCEVPALLLESSFHSHPQEEQRLRDPHYNLAEAYAIYRGLCDYAWLGRPTQSPPQLEIDGDRLLVSIQLNDGLPTGWWGGARQRTLTSTIQLRINGRRVPWIFDEQKRLLQAVVPLDLSPVRLRAEETDSYDVGAESSQPVAEECRLILQLHHANQFKQHNWPQRYEVTLSPEQDVWKVLTVRALGAMRDTTFPPTVSSAAISTPLPRDSHSMEQAIRPLPVHGPMRAVQPLVPQPSSAPTGVGPSPDKPWTMLPDLSFPVVLQAASVKLEDYFDLPLGSRLTLARITPEGRVIASRWRRSGSLGFYPASTVKWVTAVMTLDWMDRYQLTLDHVLQVGEDPPASLRHLLMSMLVVSDNQSFNTLQEAVGFSETYTQMKAWGCEKSMIRRHFTRPRYNSSRAVQLISPWGQVIQTLPGRPPAEIPLNDDDRPAPLGNPEANWFTTDDLVRILAATLMGPSRHRTYFDAMVQWLGATDQCFARDGLVKLTGRLPGSPGFVVLNKPGWWPPDGANVDACYIYDVQRREHYLLGIYVQGTEEDAKKYMSQTAEILFSALHDGRLRLEAEP